MILDIKQNGNIKAGNNLYEKSLYVIFIILM